MQLLHANDRRGEYPPSLYAAALTDMPAPRPALRGLVRADVCVVGAGYTGLSAALHLARQGRRVVVLEAHRAGFGASGRNGGQIGSGQRLEVTELAPLVGATRTRALWDLAEDAKALTFALAAEAGVPTRRGIAHCARHPAEVRHAHQMAEHLARHYDYDQITPLDRDGLHALIPAPRYLGGDIDEGAGHADPLALCLGIARLAEAAGATLHEMSEVTAIRHGTRAGQTSRIETAAGHVEADHVILAANGYLDGLEPAVAARVMPINNFILATAPLGPRVAEVLTRPIAAHDTKFVVNYWRLSEDGRLVFGGGENVSYRFPADIRGKVRRAMLEVYPHLHDVEVTHAWGGTLAITRNRLPCFTRPAPNALSASGFSGHGVAIACLAGKLMAEAVATTSERFDLMASLPVPAFPGGAALRWPLLVAGMSWFALRDRLGI
ncbi:NAD(P)/FAD-dependent oxidoreductase [Phaeovulum vinaykumarii]|uniref:Gamma-glutamylputrescine oxidase n=1 Tax=Phaeovulum vinaykumarii TaxID=407234 RepID=A0A1N7JZD5_9RHOB|nr:FAD-binding oxidoreductase [Phaeovulum vinaykumarii]SIS54699.1 gamma-glutamylputrescine oxidase [Phaeovulum vinaykumarii]SOB92038.1 gamma-glutamylputrescine oxidase [Phaeovulum vinaykumarii]